MRKTETTSFEFNPLSPRTISLLMRVMDQTEDTTRAFEALLSSTLVAASILGVSPNELSRIASDMLSFVYDKAKEHPDLFTVLGVDGPCDMGALQ